MPKTRPNIGSVIDEIKWGLQYRQLTGQSHLLPASLQPVPAKKFKEKQLQSVGSRKQNKNSKEQNQFLYQLVEGRTIVNRSVLTPQQHLRLLAAPKQVQEHALSKRSTHRPFRSPMCPPRVTELANPQKRRIYHLWKDYQSTLPAPKLEKLPELLTASNAMDPETAQYYFRRRSKKAAATKKAENRKKAQAREQLKRLASLKLEADVTMFAITMCAHLFDEDLCHLNSTQRMLSVEIARLLMTSSGTSYKVPRLSRHSHDPFVKGLLAVVDQCAVFASEVLYQADVAAAAAEAAAEAAADDALSVEESNYPLFCMPLLQYNCAAGDDSYTSIVQY